MFQQKSDILKEKISNDLIMANAVHEIRTPVQTIIGTLDLLSDTHLNTEQIEYVRQIRFGADVLLSLVNDVLDFSKLTSQKLSVEDVSFDVKTLTEQTVNLISIEAFNKNLEIETDIDYSLPDLIKGDPKRIQQVLINLLKNAVKFTEQGYIHIELFSPDKKTIQFKITDSGIGIQDKQRKYLFQNFFQADVSTSRKYGGTGLGLAISKALVKNMHGEIGFTPNKFGGSCFWFSIPLECIAKSSSCSYVLPVPATTKILIVDDSALAIRSLEKKLNSIGLQYIQTSTDAQDALLKIKYAAQIENPFSIVFIDMHMPVYDGWHLASEIKNDPILKDTKLYMLVPEGQMGSQAKMKALSWFAGYLYKPVRRDKLDELLLQTNDIDSTSSILDKLEENDFSDQDKELDLSFAKGIKIIVAEDHLVNRKILLEFLKHFGATTFEAENGEEVLSIIKTNPDIQVIFMDIQMPVLNGIETSAKLRQNLYNGVIIACTANNSKDDFITYQKAGMNDILHKPFKKEHVKMIIDKWKTVFMFSSNKQSALIDYNYVLNDELWDISDFEDTIGRDWDLGRQIILDYIEQTESLIKDAKKYIKETNFQQLDMIAHTLKGSSATISANKLFKIGEKLNKSVKNKDLKEATINLEYFEKMFEIFILSTNKYDCLK